MSGKLLLVVIAAAIPVAAPAQQASTMPETARAAWGFDRSDLTPHPGVRFGMLPTGMRYALMHNAEPAGALSVRLHVDAGASVEGKREQGFMHLLEHLLFHGSANLPQGALPLMLRHQGLRRWSDLNAYTSFDETMYRLDLSKADARSRGTALTVMRELAGNLLFDRRTVEGAKEDVQAEIRGRDAVQDRIAAAQNAFFFPGTALERGPVAGTEASVRRASGQALRRLYESHYTPRRTTLVMVGNFDPLAAEAEIATRFSDWQPRSDHSETPPALALAARPGIEARFFFDQAAPTVITVAAVEPLGGPDAAGTRDGQFLAHLGSEMLNRRLARILARPDSPFTGADSAIYDHFSTARLARIEVAARDGDWRQALREGALELRRALELGFSQAELDEQLNASRTALDGDSAPQTSNALADAIADAVGRGIVFTAPGDNLTTQAYLARVRLADVNAAFAKAWSSPGRLIFVSHDRRMRGTEAAIAQAWAAAMSPPLAAEAR